MMKKMVGLLFVVFMITACAATLLQSRTADVKINNHSYSIYIKAMDKPTHAEIFLFVNDKEVGTGILSMNRPTTVISGKYDRVKFDAECGAVKTGGINMAQKCIIYANGKKVAELSY